MFRDTSRLIGNKYRQLYINNNIYLILLTRFKDLLIHCHMIATLLRIHWNRRLIYCENLSNLKTVTRTWRGNGCCFFYSIIYKVFCYSEILTYELLHSIEHFWTEFVKSSRTVKLSIKWANNHYFNLFLIFCNTSGGERFEVFRIFSQDRDLDRYRSVWVLVQVPGHLCIICVDEHWIVQCFALINQVLLI